MNPEVWWHLARAGGIVAWLMLTASVVWGVVLAVRPKSSRIRPAWLLDLHRWLGGLAVTFTGVHLAGLVLDSYVDFGVVDLLVPFASDWNPGAVALGVVATWLLVAVQITSMLRRRIPKRWWRRVHLTSYGLFWFATLHGITAGSDATHPLYVGTAIAVIAGGVFASSYRALAPGRTASPGRAQTAGSGSSSPAKRATATTMTAPASRPSPAPPTASIGKCRPTSTLPNPTSAASTNTTTPPPRGTTAATTTATANATAVVAEGNPSSSQGG